MRKIYLVAIFSFLAAMTIFVSCRKDNSTLDVNKIAGVTFDTTGISRLTVYQFSNLVVTPKLNMEGLNEADLSFEWKINIAPNDTTYEVLSEEKNLNKEIRFRPNDAGRFHKLLYTITDNRNGLKYLMAWPLTVLNNIGEGLVIAETADNVRSDLSHIMSPLVTTGYTGESVKHNVYSSINDTYIDGIIKQLHYVQISNGSGIYAITDNSITRVNTRDYTYYGKNNDLFFTASPSYKPQALHSLYQSEVYIGDNKLTATNLPLTQKYGVPFDNKFVVPDHIVANGYSANSEHLNDYTPIAVIHFYDAVNGHFVSLNGVMFGDIVMRAYPSQTGLVFNPGNLPNKTTLAAGVGPDRGYLHLLKDKTSGNVSLYAFDAGGYHPTTGDLIPPAPAGMYDLSAAPDIANAKKFVILEDQKVMYYATATKIYAMMYAAGVPTFEERYTVPAGEEITTLQIYRQSGYPLMAAYIATNNRQLILSTYNGTEGKVSLLPMKNLGLGTIDIPTIKTFTGFRRITAITPQK